MSDTNTENNKCYLATMYGIQSSDIHRYLLSRKYLFESICNLFPPSRQCGKSHPLYVTMKQLSSIKQFSIVTKFEQIILQYFREVFDEIISRPLRDVYKIISSGLLYEACLDARSAHVDSIAYNMLMH